MQEKLWYKKSENEIYEELKCTKEGLSSKEAKHRIEKYGRNEIPKKKPDSFFKIMFKQLMDPIELLLVAAMGFSFMINEVIDKFSMSVFDKSFEQKPLAGARKIRVNPKVTKHVVGLGRKFGLKKLADIVEQMTPAVAPIVEEKVSDDTKTKINAFTGKLSADRYQDFKSYMLRVFGVESIGDLTETQGQQLLKALGGK